MVLPMSLLTQNVLKKAVAKAALDYVLNKVSSDSIIGIGTGSTTNFFINLLGPHKNKFKGAVASSLASANKLESYGIEILDLNSVHEIEIYVDGADEVNQTLELIKGGGGALTREKITAAVASEFLCMVDDTKLVTSLGQFPLPIEVIPMARSYVARKILEVGGDPVYRKGYVTDNGNNILDIHHLYPIKSAREIEEKINHIAGVVANGIFSIRHADVVLIGAADGIKTIKPN